MPVNVIGTLKPKNNGKFPVAEAVDIKVTDDLRLDKALENKADLSSVNFALDNKADKTTTTNLQSQINEIITPVTQDAEVQNARVGADGTSYTTLKLRLDTENTAIKGNAYSAKNFSQLAFENATVTQTADFSFDFKHISSNGQIVDNNNKNLTSDRVYAVKGSIISVDDGYKYQYALYDKETRAFIRRQTWLGSDTFTALDDDYYIRVEISDIQESVLSDMSILEHLHADIYSSAIPASEVTAKLGDRHFEFINGKNLKLAYPIGTVIDLDSAESVDFYSYTVTEVSKGDYIIINGSGGANPRLWGFLDENNVLLAVAPASEALATDLLLQAPEGAAKIVVNSKIATRGNCYKYGIDYTVSVLKDTVNDIESDVSELQELKLSEPNAIRQSNNIVNTLGINTFRQKTMEVAEPTAYKSWPFVGVVGNKLICLYSVGTSHTDSHSSIFVKYSDNGVIWSADRGIISTDSQRDNVTGKGYDDNGDLIFWVRRGAPGASGTTFELWKATDYKTFEQVSTSTFATANGHIGDIVNVPNYGLFAFFNTYGSSRSWGYVKSTDNGETWTETVCESNLSSVYVPVEMSPAYIGDGRILVMGRQDADGSAGTFQIQSSDYGVTFTKYSTNIQVSGATPSVIYDLQEDKVYQYYFDRATGQLKLRTATLETIWNNPTSWPSGEIIAQVDGRGQDTGNVNACQFGNIQIASFYSGDETNTGIYATIM